MGPKSIRGRYNYSIQEKDIFRWKMFFLKIFTFAEYVRTRIELYKAPCVILATIMHIIGSFQRDLNCGYSQIFQNQPYIPGELKKIDHFLSTSMTDLK